MLVCWVLVLPIAVMLSLAGSRFTLLSQYWFLGLNALGLVFGIIYNAQTPDLYPNNAHGKIGWIITMVASAQVLMTLAGWAGGLWRQGYLPLSSETLFTRHFFSDCSHSDSQQLPNDFHEAPAKTPYQPPYSSAPDHNDYDALLTNNPDDHIGQDRFDGTAHSSAPLPSSSDKLWRCCAIISKVIDRIILPFGFVAIASGLATFGRLFEGNEIFSGLAHWIKGGVFFWLGLFTLGRWTGSFGDLGWAWNLPPNTSQRTWQPSAEWVESALIFFYGSTNIFLEHLGSWGGVWSSQDLEHIAVTVLFIGGGLCGILIESATVRRLLNITVSKTVCRSRPDDGEEAERGHLVAPSYEVSLNPLPTLIILLLGVIMSAHHQTSGMAVQIHRQWGLLLAGASFARCMTYILIFLRPPRSILPSRPPTELLTAFGLITGGIVFMASSSDTVQSMDYYNLDSIHSV
ncbi:putative membrane protein C3B8.06 [Ophiocordyceps camponoti-floridani]|uniref:Putative membrane protein C3B8.06 n=1 Tax=Ophiocordyceps camponoti-floridani TaxID=2030778 RepID=A0A8H4VFY2_9HYPO|nr:putative membrane protein C3B8.06 [Ophiocordyceps camponoti-floridani]